MAQTGAVASTRPNIATAPEVQRLQDRDLAGIIRHGISGAGMPAFSVVDPGPGRRTWSSYLRVLQGKEEISWKLPGDPKFKDNYCFSSAKRSAPSATWSKASGGFLGGELTYYGADAKPDCYDARRDS